jgi:hypothetical protein
MNKSITITFLVLIMFSCQTDKMKIIENEKKPEFKEALIELLIKYPEARLNNENDVGKIGFGVEADPGGILIANYTYGKIDGVYEVYNRKTGKIQYIDSTIIGKSIGPILAFGENGQLVYTIYEMENTDTIINNDRYTNYRPTTKGYLTIYDSENNIIEEGTAFYDESIEIDFAKGNDWIDKK